ncbi:MAG: tRNA epoxyqueuosine(34) reductase QueG [Rubrivivax sp.]|nr:tRNA epoxyqueuosine(34) reductase QueG [Rubrivivax sp.]
MPVAPVAGRSGSGGRLGGTRGGGNGHLACCHHRAVGIERSNPVGGPGASSGTDLSGGRRQHTGGGAAVAGAAGDTIGLKERLRAWAHECGFSQIGIAGIDLASAEPGLAAWLQAGFHGEMGYMARHGLKRARPAGLVPGTVSVISARMDYLPRAPAAQAAGDVETGDAAAQPPRWARHELARLARPGEAVVSLYARGRDYHKVLRQRLQQLADRLAAEVGPFGHRVFTDSAPVLEVELAVRAGLGWRGKHTLALSRDAGSLFFLGEIFVDLALPPDRPEEARPPPAAGRLPEPQSDSPNERVPPLSAGPTTGHCGTCSACLAACPTGAIVAPYRLDARRCISYLTIELHGPIPPALRPAIGNRIFGCDDCQLVCPWNKYARRSTLPDFDGRAGLGDGTTLLPLWAWDEREFLRRTEGSAIRRIGHARWRRNLAVALGNAVRASPAGAERAALTAALAAARTAADDLVREHIDWALAQADAGR